MCGHLKHVEKGREEPPLRVVPEPYLTHNVTWVLLRPSLCEQQAETNHGQDLGDEEYHENDAKPLHTFADLQDDDKSELCLRHHVGDFERHANHGQPEVLVERTLGDHFGVLECGLALHVLGVIIFDPPIVCVVNICRQGVLVRVPEVQILHRLHHADGHVHVDNRPHWIGEPMLLGGWYLMQRRMGYSVFPRVTASKHFANSS
mmetsp:Transcript_131426/g.340302  ORF Transcript_131426/g.340302 Transcript_131426/m.340302 type:complete len:204 (+) Transcript_131426:910-1521(+)